MLASLLTALRDEHRNFNVLSSALTLLATSDVDVTAPLVELLQGPDTDLRMQAALALGEQQHPAAVDALVAALHDPDANVRFHAIEALGRLRAADAVEPLADIAESGDFFLAFPALDALARISDSRVAPRLSRCWRATTSASRWSTRSASWRRRSGPAAGRGAQHAPAPPPAIARALAAPRAVRGALRRRRAT